MPALLSGPPTAARACWAVRAVRAVPPRWVWAGWAAAAAGLTAATAASAAFPVRAGLAAACAVGAAAWAWRRCPSGPRRAWAAAVPAAAWVAGTAGGSGLAAVVGAAACGAVWTLHRSARPAEPEDEGFGADPAGDPDQSFTRTTTAGADAACGSLRVPCAGGGGEGHVLFWPPFAGVPAVECFPEDGVGRVKAACVLPHGVRFEIVRPVDAGDARVCFEATLS